MITDKGMLLKALEGSAEAGQGIRLFPDEVEFVLKALREVHGPFAVMWRFVHRETGVVKRDWEVYDDKWFATREAAEALIAERKDFDVGLYIVHRLDYKIVSGKVGVGGE